jgi:uncharacterized membrane protein
VGTIFLLLGLAFLVAPEQMAPTVGLELRKPRPAIEIRAMYGGFELGLGVFFLVAAARTRWIRAALAAQTLGLAGLALGRIAGIMATRTAGRTDRLMMALVVVEVAAATLGAIAFRVAKPALMNPRTERRVDD